MHFTLKVIPVKVVPVALEMFRNFIFTFHTSIHWNFSLIQAFIKQFRFLNFLGKRLGVAYKNCLALNYAEICGFCLAAYQAIASVKAICNWSLQ